MVHPRRTSSNAVLVVAGESSTGRRIEGLLELAGFSFVAVESASEARAAMGAVFFPMVVIDQELRDGDGIDLCHEVRRRERKYDAYILLLSGMDSPEHVARVLAAGADDCLSKASSDAQLVEQLKRAKLHVRVRI